MRAVYPPAHILANRQFYLKPTQGVSNPSQFPAQKFSNSPATLPLRLGLHVDQLGHCSKRELSMKGTRLIHLIAGAVLFSGASLWAQAARPSAPSSAPAGTQEPCWKQAGISQAALQQHRQIAEQTHSQVEAVCANSSLTAQQKMQQIRQIREQAHAKMDKLVSPSQMEALKSCRAKRGMPAASQAPQGAGPCGNMPMGQKGKTQPDGNQQ